MIGRKQLSDIDFWHKNIALSFLLPNGVKICVCVQSAEYVNVLRFVDDFSFETPDKLFSPRRTMRRCWIIEAEWSIGGKNYKTKFWPSIVVA